MFNIYLPTTSVDFNSIKVRLERFSCGVSWSPRLFQFHKGAIRTDGDDSWRIPIHYFNSIKVRLEPEAVEA